MIIPVVWLAATLTLPWHIKAQPPPPEPKPVAWVLVVFVAKADVFKYEFSNRGACQEGVDELKKLVPDAYYICVRTGE